jgi:hypothetical protein
MLGLPVTKEHSSVLSFTKPFSFANIFFSFSVEYIYIYIYYILYIILYYIYTQCNAYSSRAQEIAEAAGVRMLDSSTLTHAELGNAMHMACVGVAIVAALSCTAEIRAVETDVQWDTEARAFRVKVKEFPVRHFSNQADAKAWAATLWKRCLGFCACICALHYGCVGSVRGTSRDPVHNR